MKKTKNELTDNYDSLTTIDAENLSKKENEWTTEDSLALKGLIWALLFFLSYLPYIATLWIGISPRGYSFGFQDWKDVYGIEATREAAVFSLIPFFSLAYMPKGIGALYVLNPVSLIFQFIYVLKHWKSRTPVVIGGFFLFVLILLSVFLVEPLSVLIRTNHDIPKGITEYLNNQYGAQDASDMDVIKKTGHSGISRTYSVYQVSSPKQDIFLLEYVNNSDSEHTEEYITTDESRYLYDGTRVYDIYNQEWPPED